MTRVAILLLMLSCAAGGCARKVQARTQPQHPPLEAPAPPPRVIPPAPLDAVSTTPDVLPPEATPTGKPRPNARPAGIAPRPGDPKSDVKLSDPPPERVEAPDKPADPGLMLRTPASNDPEADRKVHLLLTTARGDLGRVDYRALKPDARTQYDTAKRFAEQAEAALKERNIAFALKLAEKAAELAAGLRGR